MQTGFQILISQATREETLMLAPNLTLKRHNPPQKEKWARFKIFTTQETPRRVIIQKPRNKEKLQQLTTTHPSIKKRKIKILGQTQLLEDEIKETHLRKREKSAPRRWNPAKGTMKSAGWRMRETREAKRFLRSLGVGSVSRMATAASAATTYVSINHCNAMSSSASTCSFFLLPLRFMCSDFLFRYLALLRG